MALANQRFGARGGRPCFSRRRSYTTSRGAIECGHICLSPGAGEPDFDIAWRTPDGTLVVAEVKSVTPGNERDQLRAGLGQVLDYRHRLGALHRGEVVAVIALPCPPLDPEWVAIAAASDVTLTWHPEFTHCPGLDDPPSPERRGR